MSPLRPISVVVVTILAAMLSSGAASPGVKPGTQSGAKVVKTGWWWAANDPAVDPGVAAPPQPPSPNVPKDALPVAATAGDPDKISAIELAISARPGSFVESAVLVLRESADPKANVNRDGAGVVACPVTEAFWPDGAAAAWKSRPGYDCDLGQAAGVRDESGVWTFDLTAIAALWSADARSASTSIVLVEAVDAPVSFQVAYDGPAEKGIGLKVVTSSAPPAGTPIGGSAAGTPPPAPPAAAGSGGGFGAASGGAGLSPGIGAAAPPADLPAGDVTTAEAAAAAPAAAAETTPVAAPASVTPWYSGIPAGGWALLLFALGLAYLAMLALGPDAQPAVGTGSRNGVSRALDRLRRAKSQVAGRIGG